jgi:2-polyprenyl-6-methoxyphenol hydroxylase-like FAD-dependent oxidoreductase
MAVESTDQWPFDGFLDESNNLLKPGNLLISRHARKIHRLILISGVPLSRWVNGKVLILGDAAHAMLPYMSQGKCDM